ncbi:hypothetical protein C2G38_363073 [Gigaspora rosea]|uniref:MACPF-like domain-containing protein n=1 Tax=Gigaspora rosea TaxID=44941 RepID=A0A397VYC0_9GLOM|nr:hypothetical protein C2G38_363073 [Gigaspora rosea]
MSFFTKLFNNKSKDDREFKYEPDDRELKITIQIKNKESSDSTITCKLPNKNLAEIRNLLMRKDDIFRMGTNCYFLNETSHRIPLEDEIEYKLKEILQPENILNIIQTSDTDWSRLTDKCDHGFKIREGRVEKAHYKAFEIDTNKVVKKSKLSETDRLVKRQKECKTNFDELCNRNLIANVDVSAILPWLSVFLGTSIEKTKNMHKEVSTKYNSIKVKKAEFIIPESSIKLTKEFEHDVNEALSENNTNEKIIDKIRKLKEITEKYGSFYARHIVFGGAIIEEITETSNLRNRSSRVSFQANANVTNANFSQETEHESIESEHENNVHVFGGDMSIRKDEKAWIESLNDFRKWDIIEYDEICPIFDLLNNELRRKVLEALGQRILAGK